MSRQAGGVRQSSHLTMRKRVRGGRERCFRGGTRGGMWGVQVVLASLSSCLCFMQIFEILVAT